MEGDYSNLIDHLRSGDVVAFVGAGASRSYVDTVGERHQGIKGAAELVQVLAGRRRNISELAPFEEACFLYRQSSGRPALEQFLTDETDRPGLKPLPAHILLAALPFSAYITTNYDRLLERALVAGRRNPIAIIEDTDIPRLGHGATPVVKMHGCVTRPKTLVAAADEYRLSTPFNPVIESLIRVTLANRVALYVGYGLQDHDFGAVQDWIDGHLGPYKPRGYALVAAATEYQQLFWKARGITLIIGDLTKTLHDLLRTTAASPTASIHPDEDWINSIFFESLRAVRSLPTETEVIDAFLNHLLYELKSPSFELDVVLIRAEQAAETVLRARPNYGALSRLATLTISEIRGQCNEKESAERLVASLIDIRRQIETRIGANGSGAVARNDNILLFSQSKRVGQLLRSVPAGIQETCHLFIAECRPKSPSAFQDAIAFAETFQSTKYKITILPDLAAINFLGRRQITKVILGAHEIFFRDETFESFVNTCGSDAILAVADSAAIPVYVVAERGKITNLRMGDVPSISFQEEEAIFQTVSAELAALRSSGQDILSVNVGYDLCRVRSHTTLITD